MLVLHETNVPCQGNSQKVADTISNLGPSLLLKISQGKPNSLKNLWHFKIIKVLNKPELFINIYLIFILNI